MLKQRTLKQSISATGVGLHSGEKVTLTLKPAPADHGVVFQRVDLPDTPAMRVAPTAVNDTRLSSALEFSGARVATVEHLMSALAGLGVDNVLIELTAAEVPIMDGSSGPFIYLLQTAGLQELEVPKKFVRILKPVEVIDGDKWAKFTPHHGFKAEFTIDFAHPVFEFSGKTVTIDYDSQSYVDEISRARTFGFMHEVEYLRANGLAKGGSLDNAIVLDEYKVLNGGGLRYDDEFAKHKVLDAIGDLYILGYPIIGQFTAFKSGHALNNQLLRALLADESAWEYCTFDNDAQAPVGFLKQRDYFSPAPLLPA
ncbi:MULTISPECIES: UDP-3-O-acyl-N-acetylglucosamine deacetylase [unclassified Methylophilus]|jgi:UDP-3-O-[3-hydroxymyristoyl] N-acetylglucosamine deacetylase|uniref:UDP-3-O-acyl-N-acetylglucosamine deacetylase n=1 Tax=unclassified Methylophilus TaxID=2630143 RepID=UPI00046370E1|nr:MULTISPECIES: UDP-3-O-acyl-N-acetylglucosamine deacetylase [unclassified Methylophilus]MBF4987892.1 UDP-3-O-acyl-N-acetylglucosamine deacetylase [Methylophilus sp. 14]MBF4992240.1 UDP-3-O-acyl-N-acetylglucosamine deacetylase [Methylophilus sp. QUAN]